MLNYGDEQGHLHHSPSPNSTSTYSYSRLNPPYPSIQVLSSPTLVRIPYLLLCTYTNPSRTPTSGPPAVPTTQPLFDPHGPPTRRQNDPEVTVDSRPRRGAGTRPRWSQQLHSPRHLVPRVYTTIPSPPQSSPQRSKPSNAPSYDPNTPPESQISQPWLVQRPWDSIDPIFDHDSPHLACNRPGTAAAAYIPIDAGDEITAVYWYWLHPTGPMAVWLADCGESCEDVEPEELEWFKVAPFSSSFPPPAPPPLPTPPSSSPLYTTWSNLQLNSSPNHRQN